MEYTFSTRSALPYPPAADEPAPEVPAPIGGGKDMRMNALHLTGAPVSKLSTSRLFAYLTHFGAQPLGIEWINDTSVNVVFTSAEAVQLALEYMCPPTDAPTLPLPSTQQITEAEEVLRAYRASHAMDPWEDWPEDFLDALIFPRKAHRFPRKLYSGPERDAAKKAEEIYAKLEEKRSDLPDDVPEIYRDLEEEERRQALNDPSIQTLKVLNGAMWVRFCIESADVKRKDARKESKWYKEHGGGAGKDVVPKLLEVGTDSDKLELLPPASTSDASGWDAPHLPARPDFAPGSSVRGRGAGRDRAVMDDLDEDLDTMRAAREAAEARRSASPVRSFGKTRGRPGRGSYRGRGSMAAQNELDEEMDQYSAGRPLTNPAHAGRALPPHMALDSGSSSRSSPQGDAGSGTEMIRVRGRGRKKAPPASNSGGRKNGGGMHGWDDDDDNGYGGGAHVGASSGGMRGWDDDDDDVDDNGATAPPRHHGGKSGGRSRNGQGGSSLASLTQRLGAAPGTPTLGERMGEAAAAGSLRDRLG